MSYRSREAIEAEVAALRELRPQVKPETMFGDSNVDCIDAQIDALESYWTEDDAHDHLDDDQVVERDAAIEAIQWAKGESDDAPSVGWLELVVAPSKPTKFIASGEAKPATKQLSKACSDCPIRRDALEGWLGGYTPEQYARLCHSDAVVECHVHAGSRCAGLAIYRSNTGKRQPEEHTLPADHVTIFSNVRQFIAHHSKMPSAGANTDTSTGTAA